MKTASHLVYSDKNSQIYDHEAIPAFRSGRNFVPVDDRELIRLPYGSFLFSLPGRKPVYLNPKSASYEMLSKISRRDIFAASAFLASAYLRTYLPAYKVTGKVDPLTLWAYCGVVFKDGEFYVPALRIDKDKRSDPAIHENDDLLEKKSNAIFAKYPENRLFKQINYCATEYRCLCARNLFLGRYEAPIPTSPVCNAGCLGCLSKQDENSGFKSAQFRLDFAPTPEEIAEVMVHHLKSVKGAVASFGQGCEGEPLIRGKDLARAIELIRESTDKGTVNLNTNGSLTKNVKLMIDAGLDSIRVSLNSVTEKYYTPYYKPRGYKFNDIVRTVDTAIDAGIWTSLNLFFLPGFTDSNEEVDTLYKFLEKHPVNMIQTRNLNIDPDLYLDEIGFEDSTAIGIRTLVKNLKRDFPKMTLGYYNPALKD